MSDSEDQEQAIGKAMQSYFQAENNLVTISLTKRGQVAFHYGNEGGISYDPSWAAIVVEAVSKLHSAQNHSDDLRDNNENQ